MAANVIDGDCQVRGTLRATSFVAPASSIGGSAINAADPIPASKAEHRIIRTFGQVHGSVATTERRPVHLAYGATGDILSVQAGSVVACAGAATISIDVLKNGTTILSAPIVLDNANTAYAEESGTLSVTTFAAGDVIEVTVTATAGGGTLGQGVYVNVVMNEDANP